MLEFGRWHLNFQSDEWLFFFHASFRGHKQKSIWIFHPALPPTMVRQFSLCPPRVCHFLLLSHSSVFLTSSKFIHLWSFHFHITQKWRHQRLMYSLCTPSPQRGFHKMSLFGSLNVWEGALCFRCYWNLKLERSDRVTHRGCSGCFSAGWPVLLVDGVVESVLAFVWERQTQSKQASSMCRHNQSAVGGQGKITEVATLYEALLAHKIVFVYVYAGMRDGDRITEETVWTCGEDCLLIIWFKPDDDQFVLI